MFATTITLNPSIAITVRHESSFTHNYLIHSLGNFTPSGIKIYLDYRYASSSEINHTSYVANHINFLR
jgi:hypothetical protein